MRALVVGYGRMGTFHARVLRDLGYDVVTVDPDPARGADFLSLEAVHDCFDVAAVATPPEHLVSTAYRLAGTRYLLVEKPFALNTQEAQMLAAYLFAQGSKVCVGLVEQFNPRVRELRGRLDPVESVKFIRWNDRGTFDVDLDLTLHDIDLAHHLGFKNAEFDTRAGAVRRVRRIEIAYADGTTETVDLMSHDQSPLHALWFAFLTGLPHPAPRDVVKALDVIETMRGARTVAA